MNVYALTSTVMSAYGEYSDEIRKALVAEIHKFYDPTESTHQQIEDVIFLLENQKNRLSRVEEALRILAQDKRRNLE